MEPVILFILGICCLAVLFWVIGTSAQKDGEKIGREQIEKEAIAAGVAAYDPQTKEFQFLKAPQL